MSTNLYDNNSLGTDQYKRYFPKNVHKLTHNDGCRERVVVHAVCQSGVKDLLESHAPFATSDFPSSGLYQTPSPI